MKTKTYVTLFGLFLFWAISVQAQPMTDSIFARYFANAQSFADQYPREKAHLHFDNTSYYIGDTIWYKAYVTTAEQNRLSTLSKPLYVELVDQLGNIKEHQIVELKNGEGSGQFVLTTALFSGYYEIRAYTKWMLAFDEKQYFSRTFPIYRKRRSETDEPRNIVTYKMDESMKQRPHEKGKKIMLRFYPEGGQLVQGLSSVVAFEAEDRDSGPVNIQGVLRQEKGEELSRINAFHNGMGAFVYTPGVSPAVVEVMYDGRKYTFPLPQALPAGYVIRAMGDGKYISVDVTRSSTALNDTLALFISHQGRPVAYKLIDFDGTLAHQFILPVQEYPSGVLQLSLINAAGATLCDRFCYVMPSPDLQIQATSSSALFKPYEPIEYKVLMKDREGNPVRGHFSIAVRDALDSDYQEYDNTIYTDLLLTSDLKGYIHQPGYYFSDNSRSKRLALDMMLLIHGWRKYDMSSIIGSKTFQPAYIPETDLILYGQVKSYFRNKVEPNIGVSILARRDTLSAVGNTIADSLGRFQVPMNAFDGTMEAVIQTRREGKKMNRQSMVLLDRNFAPELRKYGYEEMHPQWKDMNGMRWWTRLADSLYMDSIMGHSKYILDQVVVKAKKTKSKQILAFEQTVKAYYDIPRELDRLRDSGEFVNNFAILMRKLNPDIQTTSDITYSGKSMIYAVNGELFSSFNRELFIDKDIDCIKSVMISEGPAQNALAGVDLEEKGTLFDKEIRQKSLKKSRTTHFEDEALSDYFLKDNLPDNLSLLEGNQVVCYITTIDNWDPEKKYRAHGIRYTRIQGYNKPLEFYSPCYSDAGIHGSDFRRTLYWNPNVETDENGEAVVKCYNANSSTLLTVSIEALHNGTPAAFNSYSVKY